MATVSASGRHADEVLAVGAVLRGVAQRRRAHHRCLDRADPAVKSRQSSTRVDEFEATLPFKLDGVPARRDREARPRSRRRARQRPDVERQDRRRRVRDLPRAARRLQGDLHDAAQGAEQPEVPRLRARVRRATVGLVTGENSINPDAPVVVMTTEILRNLIYEDLAAAATWSRYVVLDEVHYIDDFPRGSVWEEIVIQAPAHDQARRPLRHDRQLPRDRRLDGREPRRHGDRLP